MGLVVLRLVSFFQNSAELDYSLILLELLLLSLFQLFVVDLLRDLELMIWNRIDTGSHCQLFYSFIVLVKQTHVFDQIDFADGAYSEGNAQIRTLALPARKNSRTEVARDNQLSEAFGNVINAAWSPLYIPRI